MTRASSVAAAQRLPRAPLFGIGQYEAGGTKVDLPVSWEDVDRDTDWATAMLTAHGVEHGRFVVISSNGAHAPWVRPFERAIQRLGGVYAASESWGFDAFRTGIFLQRLPVHMMFGLNAEVAAGLAASDKGLTGHLGHVPVILARVAAQPLLREAGLTPFVWDHLGPAVMVECPHGTGAHVNRAEWGVGEIDGEIVVSTVGPRAHRVEDQRTGVRGTVDTAACACGSEDPRVVLSDAHVGTGGDVDRLAGDA